MNAEQKTARGKVHPSGVGSPHVGQVQLPAGVPYVYTNGSELSLYDVWRILGTHKRLIAGLTLLCALASLAAALLMTPKYRAQVLLAPVSDLDDRQHSALPLEEFGGLAALAGVNLDRKDKKNEAIATLRSRRFSEQFIAAHKLASVLFAEDWDQEHERWKVNAQEDIPSAWDLFKRFDEKVRKVDEDTRTGLVTVSIEWKDPQLASQWANELVADVNATLRRQAVQESNQAVAYLQDQLKRTSVVELQQVLHRLIESEMKKVILANINKEYAFKVIDPATPPDEPFRPKVLVMVVLGAGAGLVLGAGVALVRGASRERTGSILEDEKHPAVGE